MREQMVAKWMLIVCACMPLMLGAQIHVRNPDKPAKGIWEFNPVQEWSVEEAGGRIISSVDFIRIHRNGTIYFFDYGHHQIVALNQKGEKTVSFGRKGEGPGEIKFAWDMSLIGDQLVVHDDRSYHLFDLQGGYLKTIKYSGESEGLISGTTMLKSEEEQDSQTLSLLNFKDQSEVLLKKMAAPVRLLAQGGGIRLRVRDHNIVTGVQTACSDKLIVFGQSETYRLFVSDHAGRILRSFEIKGRARPEIPREYKESRFNRLKVNGALLSKGMIRQLVQCIPDDGPFFTGVLIHDAGLILVMLPDYDNDSTRFFDIFSLDGTFLYKGAMRLPDRMEFNARAFAVSGNTMVMFTRGPDEDESTLKKFTISIPSTKPRR